MKGRPAQYSQQEILDLLAQGLTPKSISEKLGLSASRVRAIKKEGILQQCRAKPEPKLQTPTTTDLQTKIKEYCNSLGIDNRCTVRMARPGEIEEILEGKHETRSKAHTSLSGNVASAN